MHRPTVFVSTRQCCLQFSNAVYYVIHASNRDANDDFGGGRFYSCGVHAGIAKIYIIVLPMLPFR